MIFAWKDFGLNIKKNLSRALHLTIKKLIIHGTGEKQFAI